MEGRGVSKGQTSMNPMSVQSLSVNRHCFSMSASSGNRTENSTIQNAIFGLMTKVDDHEAGIVYIRTSLIP